MDEKQQQALARVRAALVLLPDDINISTQPELAILAWREMRQVLREVRAAFDEGGSDDAA